MNGAPTVVRYAVAVGLVIAMIACGTAIDPNAPTSHCSPGCTGSSVCEIAYGAPADIMHCPSTVPVDCDPYDASVANCPPCITGAFCQPQADCSPDDCKCILAHACPPNGGQCTQTSSGRLDFFCYPS